MSTTATPFDGHAALSRLLQLERCGPGRLKRPAAPPERLVLGSDWPFYVACGLSRALPAIEDDRVARRRVLFENVGRLLPGP